MLSVDWTEMVVIGVVMLIVIGPKELPAIMRTTGRYIAKLRRMAGEFRNQFDEVIRESELEELHREVSSLKEATRDLNPANMIKSSIAKTFDALDPDEGRLTDPFASKTSHHPSVHMHSAMNEHKNTFAETDENHAVPSDDTLHDLPGEKKQADFSIKKEVREAISEKNRHE